MNENVTKKTTGKEVFVVVLVILVALVTLSAKIYYSNKVAKEGALISELGNLRGAVRLYMAVNKTYPPDIKALTKTHDFFGNQEPYIRGVKLDKDGYPVDSWGNRFQYYTKRGWIYSGSQKYSKW